MCIACWSRLEIWNITTKNSKHWTMAEKTLWFIQSKFTKLAKKGMHHKEINNATSSSINIICPSANAPRLFTIHSVALQYYINGECCWCWRYSNTTSVTLTTCSSIARRCSTICRMLVLFYSSSIFVDLSTRSYLFINFFFPRIVFPLAFSPSSARSLPPRANARIIFLSKCQRQYVALLFGFGWHCISTRRDTVDTEMNVISHLVLIIIKSNMRKCQTNREEKLGTPTNWFCQYSRGTRGTCVGNALSANAVNFFSFRRRRILR